MSIYGNELFKGAAIYYSKYRPMYPSSLIRFLVNRFELNGKGQVLDLGCGTGQLTIRLSDWCEKVVGIDTEPEMIAEANRLYNELRIGNIQWFTGDLEKYNNNKSFKLVTIAKAFHWMDRPKVLADLYDVVSRGGGIAIIDNYDPNKKLMEWQEELNKVVTYWYGEDRRAGNSIYNHPLESHEEIITNSKFDLEIHHFPIYKIDWTIETILGNLYSTSYGSKRFLGDNLISFEQDVKDTLLAINENGVFYENMELSVKLGIKR